MSKIYDFIKNTKTFFAKEIRAFNASEVTPVDNLPFLPNWFWTAKLGMPRQLNVFEIRQYAKSGWVQMVVNTITRQIMLTEWDIVTKDEDGDVDNWAKDVEKIKTLLEQPNRNGDTFWDVWIPFLRDVLEIDAGVVFKGRNLSGELVELYSYDGSRFLINLNEYGIINEDEGYFQYSYRMPAQRPKPFRKDEIIYGRMNTNNELRPYGFSPLQSVVQEVELMIQSTRYNKEFFKNNAIPDGIVSVPMELEQLSQFKASWEREVKGRPHKLIFHNSDANFTPLGQTNKDMEWLDGQKWFFHIVFGAYGLSPMEAGFFEDGNRATGDSQERITVRNAVKPYLKLIESKINCEIIPELVGHDEVKFKWFPKDHVEERIEHEQTMALVDRRILTINEVRAEKGMEPVEWGDEPVQAPNPFTNPLVDNPRDKPKKDEPKDIKEENRKMYTKLLGVYLNGKQ